MRIALKKERHANEKDIKPPYILDNPCLQFLISFFSRPSHHAMILIENMAQNRVDSFVDGKGEKIAVSMMGI